MWDFTLVETKIWKLLVLGITHADEEAEAAIKHLEPDEATGGYDFFYHDGESLRDEKWRFDPDTDSTVANRRNGFREMDNFHLVDATLDALGSFTKSYRMKNEKDSNNRRVKESHMSDEDEDTMNGAVKSSNAFSGVSINTQYSSQNGYPHVSNVVGIQHLNAPNLYNGLNFQQAFTTPGFGFQQQGSLFNHQVHFPSNHHNFQLSSFLMPFFNQNNNNNNGPNQHQIFGSFSSFGTPGPGWGQEQTTEQQHVIPTTTAPITDTSNNVPEMTSKATELLVAQSTLEPIVETTEDPTLNFDIRLEQDVNVERNETETKNIQTTSRRTIEGLPTSDEESDGGVLDDKISSQVLKTLVGSKDYDNFIKLTSPKADVTFSNQERERR